MGIYKIKFYKRKSKIKKKCKIQGMKKVRKHDPDQESKEERKKFLNLFFSFPPQRWKFIKENKTRSQPRERPGNDQEENRGFR